MEPTPETLSEPLRIVGFAAEIEKDQAPAQIGALWQKAAAAGLFREGAATYGVYYAYQDRLANRYRLLVGVRSDAPAGEGQEAVEVPSGDYAVFHGEGPASEVASRLWQGVWTTWSERGERSFRVDFERFRGSPDHTTLELFIGR